MGNPLPEEKKNIRERKDSFEDEPGIIIILYLIKYINA